MRGAHHTHTVTHEYRHACTRYNPHLYTQGVILNFVRSCVVKARPCSLRANLRRLGPLRMIAAPPVGISKICSLGDSQVVT